MDQNIDQDGIEPGQSWTIDRFRPEDAEGVTRLFISVYGHEYPIKKFIDPTLLIEENLSGHTLSSVARTTKGDIIGHTAIFRSAPSERIFESGSGLVHRYYRGGHGIFTQMIIHGVDVARQLGASGLIGESVCNHPFTQKLAKKIEHPPMALEVDLMPAETYVKEKSSIGRVSALMHFKTIAPRAHTVYLPNIFVEALRFMYAGLDDERDCRPAAQIYPPNGPTTIKSQVFEFAQVARLAVHQAGQDFPAAMQAREADLMARGVIVIQVWLKLTWPWINWVVEELSRQGYFLGGILPRWFEDDGLLMQKRFGRPDWGNQVILTDRSKEIRRLVKDDWARAQGNFAQKI
ncbi:MAG: hypothetical protein HQK55_05275 [Deltaproteobacteria bacterium]|nr:hypothetical protein [Deltaproteobacteria bacterium]